MENWTHEKQDILVFRQKYNHDELEKMFQDIAQWHFEDLGRMWLDKSVCVRACAPCVCVVENTQSASISSV